MEKQECSLVFSDSTRKVWDIIKEHTEKKESTASSLIENCIVLGFGLFYASEEEQKAIIDAISEMHGHAFDLSQYERCLRLLSGCKKRKQDRLGETKVMNNGQKATIVEYRDSRDVDVEFEDGTIATNKQYSGFVRGEIRNPQKSGLYAQRLGVQITSRQGFLMTVIAYRGANDIDVQFEDGTIARNRTYAAFRKGTIRKTGAGRSALKQKRVGEVNRAKNGMLMTIIAYRGSQDIDVQFEDGTIVFHRAYANFKKGSIRNPSARIVPDVCCADIFKSRNKRVDLKLPKKGEK